MQRRCGWSLVLSVLGDLSDRVHEYPHWLVEGQECENGEEADTGEEILATQRAMTTQPTVAWKSRLRSLGHSGPWFMARMCRSATA